jgi:hypothetical protein
MLDARLEDILKQESTKKKKGPKGKMSMTAMAGKLSGNTHLMS